MACVAVMFFLFLLVGLLFYTVWATLRWVLTGRPPQVVWAWRQMRTVRQNFTQGGFQASAARGRAGTAGARPPTGDEGAVIDVQAREVSNARPPLGKPEP